MCVRQCIMSQECAIFMYNPWEAECVLGSQPCALADPHSKLMTMVFRKEENLECLIPKLVSELDSGTRLIKVRTRSSLARLDRGGNSYIGASNTPNANNLGYFWFEDETFGHTTDHVILTVSLWCSVAWLPYTVGEPIPLRAMVGGWWNGKPSYAVRRNSTSGTYKTSMYVTGSAVHKAVSTDILIRV